MSQTWTRWTPLYVILILIIIIIRCFRKYLKNPIEDSSFNMSCSYIFFTVFNEQIQETFRKRSVKRSECIPTVPVWQFGTTPTVTRRLGNSVSAPAGSAWAPPRRGRRRRRCSAAPGRCWRCPVRNILKNISGNHSVTHILWMWSLVHLGSSWFISIKISKQRSKFIYVCSYDQLTPSSWIGSGTSPQTARRPGSFGWRTRSGQRRHVNRPWEKNRNYRDLLHQGGIPLEINRCGCSVKLCWFGTHQFISWLHTSTQKDSDYHSERLGIGIQLKQQDTEQPTLAISCKKCRLHSISTNLKIDL